MVDIINTEDGIKGIGADLPTDMKGIGTSHRGRGVIGIIWDQRVQIFLMNWIRKVMSD